MLHLNNRFTLFLSAEHQTTMDASGAPIFTLSLPSLRLLIFPQLQEPLREEGAK